VNQPRHFCKACHRYSGPPPAGGALRNVPVGAGRRKNRSLGPIATVAAGHHGHHLLHHHHRAAAGFVVGFPSPSSSPTSRRPCTSTGGSSALTVGSDPSAGQLVFVSGSFLLLLSVSVSVLCLCKMCDVELIDQVAVASWTTISGNSFRCRWLSSIMAPMNVMCDPMLVRIQILEVSAHYHLAQTNFSLVSFCNSNESPCKFSWFFLGESY
jgi:hypothetical protein